MGQGHHRSDLRRGLAGLYGAQWQCYCDVFAPEQRLLLTHDDLEADPDMADQLRRYYRPDIEALAKLSGLDLLAWHAPIEVQALR